MAEIDLNAAIFYAEQHYMSIVAHEHGEAGAIALRRVIETVREMYSAAVDPDMCKGPIVVFKTLNSTSQPMPIGDACEIRDLAGLSLKIQSSFALQVLESGRYLLWNDFHADILALSEAAVVYLYQESREHFFANRISGEVRKIDPAAASMFARPTFSELKAALEDYRSGMIRYSTCLIFRTAWNDQRRLFFIGAPEYVMRNSLWQFLKSRLRASIEVRPEQNMDESHPVDIKVTWTGGNHIAVIEIKWLGKSKNLAGKITNDHGPARARDGAAQLANYLDMNAQQAPFHVTRGYLVVVDARRYGMNEDTADVTRQQGLYYRDKEIEYDPEFHRTRVDFETPLRMFAEPICG